MPRPTVVAFDVNETLMSLDAVGRLLPEGAAPLWFARMLRDGFALAVTGDHATMPELAATHLRGLVDDPAAVLAAFRELDAHPDARPALERLHDAGVRVITLTNGTAEVVEAMLEHNGLTELVEQCLSADEVRAWKPRPEPYHHAARRCGVDPGDMAMVAVHSWDVHGAARAGLVTGWCSRLERSPVDGLAPADVTGDDLVAVVDGLLALP